MQKAIAEIVELSGGQVRVSVDPATACKLCASGRGCGAALFGAGTGSGKRQLIVPVPEGLELACGDSVVLALLPRHLLRATWLAYGLPLAALVVVPLAAELLAGPLADATLAGLAAASVALAIAAGRRRLRDAGCLHEFLPTIDGRVERNATES